LHPENNLKESNVKRIKLVCSDPHMVTVQAELTFDQLAFTDNKKVVNVMEHCFNKSSRNATFPLFSAVNKTEFYLSAESALENSTSKFTDKFCLSDPLSYALEPGNSTEHFIYTPDTSSLKKNIRHIKFLLEGFIKNEQPGDVHLVIAQDNAIKMV